MCFQKFLSPLVLVMFSYLAMGQTKDISYEIDVYFKEALSRKSYYISTKDLKTIELKNFLREVSPYKNHQNQYVRYKSIDLIKRKALTIEPGKERLKYTDILVMACRDKDSGNSGYASKSLTLFNMGDFSSTAKDSLLAYLTSNCYHYDRIIKLNGFLGINEAKAFLEEKLVNDSTLSKKREWTVNLALARMGNEVSIKYCLDMVKTLTVNDDIVYTIFPDLAYTRQPDIFKYMLSEINSDEKKCMSSNPDSEAPIICAFKIMELLAPYIKDFPVPLTSYGELEIDDYNESLNVVREWITKGLFTLDNETF